jgi:hypothetical protein
MCEKLVKPAGCPPYTDDEDRLHSDPEGLLRHLDKNLIKCMGTGLGADDLSAVNESGLNTLLSLFVDEDATAFLQDYLHAKGQWITARHLLQPVVTPNSSTGKHDC